MVGSWFKLLPKVGASHDWPVLFSMPRHPLSAPPKIPSDLENHSGSDKDYPHTTTPSLNTDSMPSSRLTYVCYPSISLRL